MKILLLGANGFLGAQVKSRLAWQHEVFSGQLEEGGDDHTCHVNLLDQSTIANAILEVKPDAIVNCAGIVENTEKAALNVTFTSNLLEAAVRSGLSFKRIIVTGSAGEYGVVKPKELPVSEDIPLRADSHYGLSKIEEEQIALKYREQHGLPVVIARVFNPIGSGMHPRMLIPGIIRQIHEIEAGERATIEVSRLDAKRDYIGVKDVASAYAALINGHPAHPVYNIGSGQSTSNQELIEFMLKDSKLKDRPKLVETSDHEEPLYAIQADITRIQGELGWKPEHTIAETVKEIFDAHA
jgi:nucleoside-diphosphate-sugar epimerase